MQLEIIQPEEDKTNYFERVCGFFKAHGINTKEQLEQRFDCLMTEFAMKHHGKYDAVKKLLRIT